MMKLDLIPIHMQLLTFPSSTTFLKNGRKLQVGSLQLMDQLVSSRFWSQAEQIKQNTSAGPRSKGDVSGEKPEDPL